LKRFARFACSATTVPLAAWLTILCGPPGTKSDGAGCHRIDHCRRLCYVLWETSTTNCILKLRFATRGRTGESADRVLSGSGGDLGGGDAPIPESS